MSDPRDLELNLYIFILAGFLGYRIISRIPPLLHTPLMSATNALSGISLIGSLVIAGAQYDPLSTTLGFIAVCCSATNVVGGFLITDRMLKMFRTSDTEQRRSYTPWVVGIGAVLALGVVGFNMWEERLRSVPSHEVLRYLYIVSAVLFILGLQGLTSPRRARAGILLAALGMAVAIVSTLFHEDIKSFV
jgi:proton-translocating NAD(P)+ transhydrogenase subunit alpha